ncbi:tyrosine-type recombinase/integrase [Endozoicomonas sp. SESOKO3]|uniref:tyrosine-type recombinase/integrase n=1 Tax=Endozoicomonas sp. SESOKO3 TaxID=2828744 RepID=UPI0021496CCF|nr:tyrosine-type recombinase/integrase [Endozoicomonas sp. SESOKO3]
MGRRRTKPWKRVKTDAGWRIKYDYKDQRLGISRTRETFNTNEEAEDFHERLIANAKKVSRGEKPERFFGEAMMEYLTLESPSKTSHGDDLSNAAMLRIPFEFRNKFWRLEDLALNDSETGIVVGLELYFKDQLKITKRSYLNKELYQLRKERGGSVWYHQPHPASEEIPQPRYPVTDPALLKRLNQAKGRGPVRKDTLRLRQTLASTILSYVYRKLRWIDMNLADFIDRIEPGKSRIDYLTSEQFFCLIEKAEELYGSEMVRLIKGAAWIGWRRSNLIGLTWDRVFWPEKVIDPITGEEEIRPGYLIVHSAEEQEIDPFDRSQRETRTKNKDTLITTMTRRIELLLRECEMHKRPHSDVVFHNGNGQRWGEFRKKWNNLKTLLNIPERFRWHDLRHTWTTEALNAGVDDRTIMDEQGWKDRRMVDRYAHTRLQDRLERMNKVGQSTRLHSKGDDDA